MECGGECVRARLGVLTEGHVYLTLPADRSERADRILAERGVEELHVSRRRCGEYRRSSHPVTEGQHISEPNTKTLRDSSQRCRRHWTDRESKNASDGLKIGGKRIPEDALVFSQRLWQLLLFRRTDEVRQVQRIASRPLFQAGQAFLR